ncbi:hypothetical protein ABZ626_31515 [Streptomyces longispororuber]|uniref:hypothetical protein n=1 Tax=Streptomyces longispororuber TaxID=68230 RepID=UPI0033F731C5
MGDVVGAVVGFPGVVFSSALAVVICFWLLVAAGVARAGSFDEDADLDAVRLGGVPVAVAVSLFVVAGWAAGVTGSVTLARADLRGVAHAASELGLLLVSTGAGWAAARAVLRPLARRFPAAAAPPPGPVAPAPAGHPPRAAAEPGRPSGTVPGGAVAVPREPSAPA